MIAGFSQLPAHRLLNVLRRIDTGGARIAVFLLFASAILLRQPTFLISPRFWCEEGAIYFKQAFEHGTLDSLLFCYGGYYCWVENASAWLASRVAPLTAAPLVTTLIAFGVQLVPPGIILWSRADYWDAAWKKSLGLLIVLLAPLTGEIWLTTVCSKFHLTLAVLLLLAEDVSRLSRRQKWAYRGLLAVAAFSSPLPAFAACLFILKYLSVREREVLWQGGLLVAGGVLQLAVLLQQPGWLHARQQEAPAHVYALVAFNRAVVLPFGGLPLAQWLALHKLQPLLDAGSQALPVIGVLVFVFTCGSVIWLAKRLNRRRQIGLLGAWVIFLAVPCLTSGETKDDLIYPHVGSRYFYVPNVLLGLLLLERITGQPDCNRRVRRGALVLLAVFLAQGAWAFRVTYHDARWKSWRHEVELWTHDHHHPVQLAPGHWTVSLRPVRPHGCKDPACTNGVAPTR